VKDLHAKIQQQIEKNNEQYAHKANKGWKLVRFEPGDWVGCIWGRKGFLNKEDQSWCLEEMVLIRS
jgi:hypothetical protein